MVEVRGVEILKSVGITDFTALLSENVSEYFQFFLEAAAGFRR